MDSLTKQKMFKAAEDAGMTASAFAVKAINELMLDLELKPMKNGHLHLSPLVQEAIRQRDVAGITALINENRRR
jgi:hypothetical protein